MEKWNIRIYQRASTVGPWAESGPPLLSNEADDWILKLRLNWDWNFADLSLYLQKYDFDFILVWAPPTGVCRSDRLNIDYQKDKSGSSSFMNSRDSSVPRLVRCSWSRLRFSSWFSDVLIQSEVCVHHGGPGKHRLLGLPIKKKKTLVFL